MPIAAFDLPKVRLRLLGACAVSVDDVPIGAPANAKSRSLLAYLALRQGKPVRRERLMAEFWPDAEPNNARNNLKTALSTIRRFFRDAGLDPDAMLVADRDEVRFLGPVEVDADELERCSAGVRDERARAMALYTAEFLTGDYHHWAVERRERVGAHFEDVLRAELAAHRSVEVAERLLLLDPFCNDAYVALIEEALALGNRREANAVFRRYAGALEEIGMTPGSALAERVGAVSQAGTLPELGFIGRSNELAEFRAWLHDGNAPRVAIVHGLAGIGKSAFVAEATRNAAFEDRTIVLARPHELEATRAAYPGAREFALGALTRDEVALALARWSGARNAGATAETLWSASLGHPMLIGAEVARAARDASAAATPPRYEPEIVRAFEEQLDAAGPDAVAVAELLALESELDDDDLAALLDWSLRRVADAVDRLVAFGIVGAERPAAFAFPVFADVAERRVRNGRRHEAIVRITQRLALREHPRAKRRLAQHYMTLGRERDAASASLEAGRAFVTFGAWSNALSAFDEGIAQLEAVATSPAAMLVLRDLYLKRGDVLNQLGNFAPALRSLDSALALTDETAGADAALRAVAFVKAGHAFAHLNNVDSAWMAVREAEKSSRRAGALETELEAADLASRLLCNAMHYDDAIATASAAYDRAMAAGAFRTASALAQRIGEPLRRQLRFADCALWAERQLNAAAVAGPELEAQARFALGAVAYSVHQLDRAEACCREGLRVLGSIRRRRAAPLVPAGLTEWQCHQALAHVAIERGHLDEALAESAWLVRSPWVFNTTGCAAMTLATVVDIWLASGTERDRRAAFELAERIPPISADNPAFFLDALTRARLAAIAGPRARAIELLHAAYAAIVDAEPRVPHQVHISYEKLSAAAANVDDLLAARAAERGRRHRDRVVAAAGAMWSPYAVANGVNRPS